MKVFRLTALAVLVIAFSTLVFIGLVHAQSFQSGSTVTLPQDKTVDGTFYASGRSLDIAGNVNGDVFCAGQNITISGTVHGDIICAGQTVEISGSVDGNVRLAGQSVSLSGTVNHNASITAQNFTAHESSKIVGDLSFAGNTLLVNGSVGRDIVATGGNLDIGGRVGRNIKASTARLTFNSNANVLGNVAYISDNNAAVADGAIVKQLSRTTPTHHNHFAGEWFGFGLIWFAYILLTALLGALILILLFPKAFHSLSEEAVQHLWQVILIGFLASIAMPALITALLFTVIGIPLALLLLLVWMVLVCLSLPVTAYYLGSMILSKSKNPILIMLLGTVVLVVLLFLPIVGIIIGFVAMWIGVGCLLRLIKQHWPKPVYKL